MINSSAYKSLSKYSSTSANTFFFSYVSDLILLKFLRNNLMSLTNEFCFSESLENTILPVSNKYSSLYVGLISFEAVKFNESNEYSSCLVELSKPFSESVKEVLDISI